jgi:hypothetical protein
MSVITPYPKNTDYGVTEDGRVFRIRKSRFGRAVPFEMSQTLRGNGYFFVGRGGAGGLKLATVHRMVAETFLPNPENLPEIAHNNGIRTDNRLTNLRWTDRAGNMADRNLHLTDSRGSLHGNAKLREIDVITIRQSNELTRTLAHRYSVSKRLINRLRAGEGWTHV